MRTTFAASVALSLISAIGYGAIIDYKDGDPLQQMFESHDYNMVSVFKPSDPESVEINELLTGTEALFESKVASGEWSKRSVGWFRIDIEKYPQFAFDENATSQQMMAKSGEFGTRKLLGLQKAFDESSKNMDLFASVIRELSGDWITQIDCDDIHDEDRKFYDQVIYFGDKKDLEADGQAEAVNDLAISDTFTYMDSRVAFHYNEDPKCRKAYDLDPEKTYIAFFNGDTQPQIMTVNEDYITLEQMKFTLNTSIVKGTPQWGQRSFNTMFEMQQNAVIYYMPEGETMHTIRSDWRVMLMAKINEWMQTNSALFIPIVQTWEADSSETLMVPTLRKVLKIESQGELPHLFIYHARSDTVMRYPEILHNVQKFSPEIVMFWAQIQVHEKEIAMLRERVENSISGTEDEKTKLSYEQVIKVKELVKNKEEELVELRKIHDKTADELAENNVFAKFVNKALGVDIEDKQASGEEEEVQQVEL